MSRNGKKIGLDVNCEISAGSKLTWTSLVTCWVFNAIKIIQYLVLYISQSISLREKRLENLYRYILY